MADIVIFEPGRTSATWTGVRQVPYGVLRTKIDDKDVRRVWANVYGRPEEEYRRTEHGLPVATELLTRMLNKLEKI